MNTPESSSEQLLATVLKQFPLASQWENMCSQHKEKTLKGYGTVNAVLILLMLGLMGGFFALVASTWDEPWRMLDKFFVTVISLSITTPCCAAIYYAWKTICYNLSPKKQKKHLRSNKPAVRDYLRRQKAVRSVAALLPEFSTADLKLLLSHPQFNTDVFKEVFEAELQKRRDAKIVRNVNLRFSDNYVDVDFPEPQDVFGGTFTTASFAAKS